MVCALLGLVMGTDLAQTHVMEMMSMKVMSPACQLEVMSQ